jgi:anthranilate phosphoribosyltransferase
MRIIMLDKATPLIRKVSQGESLTSEETRKALNIIGDEDTEGYYFLAFSLGIMAKGPTPEELYGFSLDLADRMPKLSVNIDPNNLTDISGSGGDKIKTFNIGTTSSFVISAAGIYVAKQAAPAFTGYSGSGDIFNEIGVDVPYSNGNPDIVKNSLERIGITAFYYPSFTDRFDNRTKWRDKMRKIGLTYITPWHFVSFAPSPFEVGTRIYGVFTDKHLLTIAKLFQKLGYRRGMVVHGVDGLDEISNLGPTKICEFKGNEIQEYEVNPQDLGVKRAKAEEIAAVDRQTNILTFLRVVYGKEGGAKQDIVSINAGACLYITGKAKSLIDGVELAQKLIEDGDAASKLEELVRFHGNQEKLERWKKIAEIE